MTILFFIDESGIDHKESPYEVLAGISIKDRNLWSLIQDIKAIEKNLFGNFYKTNKIELKAKKLLKTKTFRLANQLSPINIDDLPALAQQCLVNGEKATRLQLTALSQAKLLYATQVIQACSNAGGRVFASIIDYDAAISQPALGDVSGLTFLRKDYSYLFERFYYYLEDSGANEMGIIVFDEFDKVKSHLLLGQMTEYFINTRKGQERSSLIIPEPFFVHSDLTMGVQIVDLAAYILSWGFRIKGMTKPERPELQTLVSNLCNMRVLSKRIVPSIRREPIDIWSIVLIDH
jgi:hypothetical protein